LVGPELARDHSAARVLVGKPASPFPEQALDGGQIAGLPGGLQPV